MDFQSDGQIKPKDLKESLASAGLQSIGKQKLIDLIERKYYSGEIRKQDYYRIKNMFNEIENKFGAKSEYIEELENEVNNRAKYCR